MIFPAITGAGGYDTAQKLVMNRAGKFVERSNRDAATR